MKKSINYIIIVMLVLGNLFIIPSIAGYTSDEYDTTSDFDNGHFNDTTTKTVRYAQSFGTLELDFPYAEKDDNLTSYWRMENLTDETGIEDIVNTGGASVNNTAKFDKGYSFDGSVDYMTIDGSGGYEYAPGDNESFTAVVWLNIIDNSDYHRALSKYNGANGWELIVYNTGKVRMGCKNSSQTYRSIETTGVYWDTGWHMFTCRRNNDSDQIELYVDDGVEDLTGLGYNGSLWCTLKLHLGRYSLSPVSFYEGTMDELKYYHRYLSDSELDDLYNSGNQYISSGNWSTPTISVPSGEVLNNITFDTDAKSNNYIDNITVEWSSNQTVIGYDATNYYSDNTLTYSNFTPSTTFNQTDNENIQIRLFLAGNNTDTPTINLVNYTTLSSGDSTAPVIANVTDTPDPQEYGGSVNVTCNVTDETALSGVWINITYPNSTYTNSSMTNGSGNYYHFDTPGLNLLGLYNYTISANDTSDNWVTYDGNFTIQDSIAPELSDRTIDGFSVSTYYLNASGTIAVNLTASDNNTGNSTIGGGNISNIPGTQTWNFSAIDGTFDEITEGLTATINGSDLSAPASHYLSCNVFDNASNYNTSQLGFSIIRDDGIPTINNVKVNGFDTVDILAGDEVNITVDFTDIYGLMEGANWTDGAGGWPGTSMISSDGAFNGISESGYSVINTSNWNVGIHKVYVSAWDQADLPNYNTSGTYATITVRANSQLKIPIDIDFEYRSRERTAIFNYTGDFKAIQEYRWNFGDGVGISGENETSPVHTYSEGEKWNVQLEILTQDGRVYRTEQIIFLDEDFIDLDLENGEMRIGGFTYWIPLLTITGIIGLAIAISNPKWLDKRKYWNSEMQALFSTLALSVGLFFLVIEVGLIRNPFIA